MSLIKLLLIKIIPDKYIVKDINDCTNSIPLSNARVVLSISSVINPKISPLDISLKLFKDDSNKLSKNLILQNLPTKKMLIYTRNLWKDDIFKFWVANQINNRSKLIYGQIRMIN